MHAGGLAFKGNADVFGDWQIWVFMLGMATLAFVQLVILNQGLARFPALVFIPSYTVLYICMGTSACACTSINTCLLRSRLFASVPAARSGAAAGAAGAATAAGAFFLVLLLLLS
jgi:hypothetical protein